MISDEERRLIPLVSKNGCVDLKILRKSIVYARMFTANAVNEDKFKQLFVYYYLRESDPHGDEIMQDG
jgi:hypothetical protein